MESSEVWLDLHLSSDNHGENRLFVGIKKSIDEHTVVAQVRGSLNQQQPGIKI